MPAGPRNLITDVSGLLVGNASDAVLKSGVTVLTSDHPFRASVDIRGGAPGTRDTALLEPERTVDQIDALVLSGGSAFGLGAAEGVMAALRAANRGFAVGPVHVPIVPTAIIFDLANGGVKDWVESPYPALGRSAFDAAASTFEIGTAGAGVGALTARLKGGLGSTSARVGEWMVGALVVANPIGHVGPPGSRQFWAGAFEEGAEFGNLGAPRSTGPIGLGDTKLGGGIGTGGNTTIAIVATDAPLDKAALRRLAVAAQDGIARAIVPAPTALDGDLVFAVSTAPEPQRLAPADVLLLGHAAATSLARAIARAIFAASPALDDTRPTWSTLPADGDPPEGA